MRINPRKYKTTFRHDKFILEMLKDYMKKMDCDKSTAVRELLQFILEMGGVNLIK